MELTLIRSNGDVLCKQCELADNPVRRTIGLLGRRDLAADAGILLATSSIHTSFMRFDIDVVFLDQNYAVVKTIERLKPWRVARHPHAHAVAELSAGALARTGVRVGDQISLVRLGESSDDVVNDDSTNELRVAIASSDSRFLRVATFLLARHAYRVDTYDDPASVVEKATQADVLVLDASASLTSTARLMRDVAVASPSTGVVVVGDSSGGAEESGDSSQGLRVVPKWDSFDRLVAEIQLASARTQHELL